LFARSRRQRTGAAGDVEQPVTRLEPNGLQARRDRIGGDRREEMIVALGERVVARALKGAESRAIGFRRSVVIRLGLACAFEMAGQLPAISLTMA